MPPPLTILWRDARFVAVDKPAGLLMHRSPIAERVETSCCSACATSCAGTCT